MSIDNLFEPERKKNVNQKIFLLALMLLVAMAFAGCDSTPPRPQQSDSTIIEGETIKIATPDGFVRVDGWFPAADGKLNEMVNKQLGGQKINFLATFCSDEKNWKKTAKTISDDSNFLFGRPDQMEIVVLLEMPFITQMIQSGALDLNDKPTRDVMFSGFAESYKKNGGHTFGNVPKAVLGYNKMPSKGRKQGHGYLVGGMMIIKKQCLLNVSVLASKKDSPANETKIKNISEQ